MDTEIFNYHLPTELIAQEPITPRDHSRLMFLNRKKHTVSNDYFYNLPQYLDDSYVLVFNQSKVLPARLYGHKSTGGKIELLLIKKIKDNTWECLTSPGGKINQTISFDNTLQGKFVDVYENGIRLVEFNLKNQELLNKIIALGTMPTPPYIKKALQNSNQYQTTYAKDLGSVAAPTAGFHFTQSLLHNLQSKGIATEFITLHVGLGTFQPVKEEKIETHQMHSEWFEINQEVADRLNQYKQSGKKIISVGTTTTRALEAATTDSHIIQPYVGETKIFIYPGYQFKCIDGIITNFHLPKSTLIMLISAFAGLDFTLQAYQEAINLKYRFYSFGDGMLIL